MSTEPNAGMRTESDSMGAVAVPVEGGTGSVTTIGLIAILL